MKKKASWRYTPKIDRSWLEDESEKQETPAVYSEDEGAALIETPPTARVEMEQLSERVRSMSEFSVAPTPEYVPDIKAEQVVNVPANEQVFIPPVQHTGPVVTVPANEQIFTPPVQAAPVITPPAAATFVPPAQPNYVRPNIPVQPAFKPNIPAVPPTQRIAERLAQQRSEAARPVTPAVEAQPVIPATSNRPFYPESYFVPIAPTQPVVERTEKSIFAKPEGFAPAESFAPPAETVQQPVASPVPPAPPVPHEPLEPAVLAETPVHTAPTATRVQAIENFFAPEPVVEKMVVPEPATREPQAPRYATGEPPAVRFSAPEPPPEPQYRPEIPAEPKFEMPTTTKFEKPAVPEPTTPKPAPEPVFDPLFAAKIEEPVVAKFEEPVQQKHEEPVRARFEAPIQKIEEPTQAKHEEPAEPRYSEFIEEAPRKRFEPALNIPKVQEVKAVPKQDVPEQATQQPQAPPQAPRQTRPQAPPQPRPKPEYRPTQPVHQREHDDEAPSGLTRMLNAVRAAIPVVRQLLPLLEGNVAKAVSNLLAPAHTTAIAPAVQKVDIAPLERRLLDLNKQHRELSEQVAAQNQGLQRVEDQLMHVRTATDRNTLEQQELIEEMQKMEKRQGRFALIILFLLILSLAANALLYWQFRR
jgi:hypothetical protein